MTASKLQALWNHPAGPKTIHFWAPTFKWGISIANVADFAKPPEKISYPQQIGMPCNMYWNHLVPLQHRDNAGEFHPGLEELVLCIGCKSLSCLGDLFCPNNSSCFQKNWNLFSVNVAMAATGMYQLSRKLRHDYSSEKESALAEE
ncbi:Mitochondrial pyruvate carrier 4 [Linum grandiflorum]